MEKGKIELPWNDFFSPSRRACGLRFYLGSWVWRALPKGYEFFELKILALSTAAPSLATYRGSRWGLFLNIGKRLMKPQPLNE